LRSNEPKNNGNKLKWLVELIEILALEGIVPEEERELSVLYFSSGRL